MLIQEKGLNLYVLVYRKNSGLGSLKKIIKECVVFPGKYRMKNCGLSSQTQKTDMNYNPNISGVKKVVKTSWNHKMVQINQSKLICIVV